MLQTSVIYTERGTCICVYCIIACHYISIRLSVCDQLNIFSLMHNFSRGHFSLPILDITWTTYSGQIPWFINSSEIIDTCWNQYLYIRHTDKKDVILMQCNSRTRRPSLQKITSPYLSFKKDAKTGRGVEGQDQSRAIFPPLCPVPSAVVQI